VILSLGIISLAAGGALRDHQARARPAGTGRGVRKARCDTASLVQGVEQLTGLTLSSFDGCYRMTQFTFIEE
jgi:hypothetical protein